MAALSIFKKNAFGLDISDASIEAMQLKKSFGKINLARFNRIILDAKIVEDGRILDKENLAKAISRLILQAKPKPIKSKNVILSLPESRVFTYIFRFPYYAKDEEIKRDLPQKAATVIPEDFSNLNFDYKIIYKGQKEKEVFFVACSKNLIQDYLETLEAVHLKPVVLDMESASLARALIKPEDRGASVILDIGARTTIISIFAHDAIQSTVNLPCAGNLFTEAISSRLGLNLKEAEKLKRECGLDSTKKEGKVMRVLQGFFQEIIRELQKSINFFQKKTNEKVERIILAGGSAQMPRIAPYFEENTQIKTRVGNPWQNVEVNSSLFGQEKSIFYATCLGLALRGIKSKPEKAGINLI